MKIGSNSVNMGMPARRNLENANAAAVKSMRNTASGKKMNRAGDDASGLAIVQQLLAQLTGSSAAGDNTQDAISMVRTADGALGSVEELTGRMDELASKAGSSLLSDDQRQSLQDEYDQLSEEIDRIGQSSTFNGNKLFDGSTYQMQVGENASDSRPVHMAEISSSALRLDQADLRTAEGARKAKDHIREARGTISSSRADLGAAENGMRRAYDSSENRRENLAASMSRIIDADLSRESIDRSVSNVLAQTSLAMMRQSSNLMQYNAMQLLR